MKFTPNPSSWGPLPGEDIKEVGNITYAHFDKKERKFPAGDFSPAMSNLQKQVLRRRADDNTTEFTFRHDAAEENSFQLVDTSKSAVRKTKGKSFDQFNFHQNETYKRRFNEVYLIQMILFYIVFSLRCFFSCSLSLYILFLIFPSIL